MDLKQYIHEVISQIAEATKGINGGESDTRLIVNPTLKEDTVSLSVSERGH